MAGLKSRNSATVLSVSSSALFQFSDYVGDLCDYKCGDVNDDGKVDILDIVSLINYNYKGGNDPECVVW